MNASDASDYPSVRSSRLLLVLKIALCVLITAAVLEAGLRLLAPWDALAPALASPVQEELLWQYDEVLGWSHIPNVSGPYSNGYFEGFVSIDENGNRRNSRDGTYNQDYRTIFFIGDSATASLEVNDDETLPALLEADLRKRGQRVNVVNLGVRGYGTDQAVRKAIQLAPRYGPTEVIYLYVINDAFDNNLIRRHKRRFGKGVYVRRPADGSFHEYNYPVPRYADDYAGLVSLDENCKAQVYEISIEEPDRDQTTDFWIRQHSYLYRTLRFLLRRGIGADALPSAPGVDPLGAMRAGEARWSRDFDIAYQDGGAVRERCREYFESQFRFLFGMLRQKIPTLRRIHVVQFPEPTADHSTARNMFSSLQRDGVIDSLLDVDGVAAAEGVDTTRFRCPADAHFCREGNRWLASKILEKVPFADSQDR